jgi:chemotaxis protein CheC
MSENETFDEVFLDTLSEIVNMGIGEAVSILNDMVGNHIEMYVPSVTPTIVRNVAEQVNLDADTGVSCVDLEFFGMFSGKSLLLFENSSAYRLGAVLVGEDPDTLGLEEILSGSLNEIGNIVLNSVLGSMANALEGRLDFEPPQFLEGSLKSVLSFSEKLETEPVLLIQTHFKVDQLDIEGYIFLFLDDAATNELKQRLAQLL